MSANLEDLHLYVRYDEGSGPPIVYLHGINSDASDWRVVIDTIGPGYRHIAVDLLGFGESPKPTDVDYTADDHTVTIRNTLLALDIGEPLLLVGYSLGGDIAIRYASTYPADLRRLFLLSAPFYLPPEAMAGQEFGTKYLKSVFTRLAWRFVGGAKRDNDLLYRLAEGRLQDFAKSFLRTDDVSEHWDIMSKNLENCIAKATFVDDLPKLDMPVTFALGVRDVIVQPDQTPALKSLKPDIEIRRIVGLNADHFMLVALPERVAQEIVRDEIRTLNLAERTGHGDPPIVLLHGIESDGRDLAPLARALAVDHEAAAVDLLGFGDSMRSKTLRYTLDDHALAVENTLRAEFTERPAILAGQGLGANVALGVAARHPELVERVVAVSPVFLAPEIDEPDAASLTKGAARSLAASAEIDRFAHDPRMRAAAADRQIERLVPMKRSLDNAIVAIDADELLSRQTVPVRLVVPSDPDTDSPVEYLEQAAARSDVLEVSRPDGDTRLMIESPAVAAAEILPDESVPARRAAAIATPPSRERLTFTDTVRSIENQVLLRGVLEILFGVFVLVVLRFTREGFPLVSLAFAGWVTWEGVFTIVGSFGLRREKKGWVTYFLLGALSLAVGGFLLLQPSTSEFVLGVLVVARALYLGVTNILVARSVGDEAPKPKWVLYVQGALGLAIGLGIVFVPELGGRLLRWTLGGYFVVSGSLLVIEAGLMKRRIAAEARRLVRSGP